MLNPSVSEETDGFLAANENNINGKMKLGLKLTIRGKQVKPKVAILHTNDLHSHFENFPQIIQLMHDRTQELEQDGYTVFRVDDGDAIDRFEPLTDATSGQANIELLNQIHYHAATIGNNEALTTSHQELSQLYQQANFPIVLDNVLDQTTGRAPDWTQPYADYQLKDHTRVRFMGLTFPYPTFRFMGWQAEPVVPSIQRCLHDWQGQYDVLVLLSHLGINQDRHVADQFPEIDVLVGGHTHHLLPHGELRNHTLLTAAEKWGHYVGEIKLEISDHHVVHQTARVLPIPALQPDSPATQTVRKWRRQGRELLAKQKVAELPAPVPTSFTDDNPLIQLGLKAVQESMGVDAAVLNTGLFLHALPAGIVNMEQIQSILPHNIHVMKTTFSGYDLWRLMKEMQKNRNFLIPFPQKGMGFRGSQFGLLVAAGVHFNEHHQLMWHDHLVNPDQEYTIGLLDHYQFIPFFPTIDIVGKNHIYFELTLKTVLANYLARHYPIQGGTHGS
ncbi:bifunctional metallophosphatase/5'-nucleotidase [Fructilactobacillus ixorae]|uniref:Bifunctional metallophosphatase/5'-nucleotidase n=1 Tax=Fructilactobacillus ixorae TaxID=1750535 RepID=A0ABY5C5S2_9LACO|nr:bifunctional UDP-sugar hydrolase/5'-nucleotidase [Fructilactobacillus ixorae]USS93791.1 bifunctional metallophosphatase/5'-nucleotidase [Fructilactobacillus ixorae]